MVLMRWDKLVTPLGPRGNGHGISTTSRVPAWRWTGRVSVHAATRDPRSSLVDQARSTTGCTVARAQRDTPRYR